MMSDSIFFIFDFILPLLFVAVPPVTSAKLLSLHFRTGAVSGFNEESLVLFQPSPIQTV